VRLRYVREAVQKTRQFVNRSNSSQSPRGAALRDRNPLVPAATSTLRRHLGPARFRGEAGRANSSSRRADWTATSSRTQLRLPSSSRSPRLSGRYLQTSWAARQRGRPRPDTRTRRRPAARAHYIEERARNWHEDTTPSRFIADAVRYPRSVRVMIDAKISVGKMTYQSR